MADKNTTKASDKINRADIRSTVDGTFLLYKNRPLVREENILCYGQSGRGLRGGDGHHVDEGVQGKRGAGQGLCPASQNRSDAPEGQTGRAAGHGGRSLRRAELGTIWLDRYLAS